MATPLSTDLRQRITRAYLAGEGTRDQIAERFEVGSATVGRLVRLVRATGSVEPKPHAGGVAPRIGLADRERLEGYLAENPSLTQDELAQQFAHDTGRQVSQRTMSRVLRRLGITRKKTPYASQRERPDVVEERAAFVAGQPLLEGRRLVFVDESGCAPGQRLGYGYARRGERCIEGRPLRPKGRVNLVGWMSSEGGGVVSVPGHMNGAAFEQFVREELVPVLEVGDVVLWDGAWIHTAEAVRLVEASGCRVVKVPRYSPEFNAIELLWSKLKHLLRKCRADTYATMIEGLRWASKQVSLANMAAWIRHCGYSINLDG